MCKVQSFPLYCEQQCITTHETTPSLCCKLSATWEHTVKTLLTLPLEKSPFNPVKKSWLPFFLPNLTVTFFSSFFFSPMKTHLPPNRRERRALWVTSGIRPIICRFNDNVPHGANHFMIATKRRIFIGQCKKVTPVKTTLPPSTRLCNMTHYISFQGGLFQSLWYKQ